MMRSRTAVHTKHPHQFAFFSNGGSSRAYATTDKARHKSSSSSNASYIQSSTDRNPTSTLSPYAKALKQVALRGTGGAFGPSSKELDLRLYAKNMLPPDYKSPVQGKWDDTVERWAYAWQFPNAEDSSVCQSNAASTTSQIGSKGYSFQLAESCGRRGIYSPLSPLVELAEYIRKYPEKTLLSEVRNNNTRGNDTTDKENVVSFIEETNQENCKDNREGKGSIEVFNDTQDVAATEQQVSDIIRQALGEGYTSKLGKEESTTVHQFVSEEESFLGELSLFNPNVPSRVSVSSGQQLPMDVLRASLLAHNTLSDINIGVRDAIDMLPACATVPLLPHQVPPGIPRAYVYDGSTLSQLSVSFGTILMEGLELPFDEDGIEVALYALTYACQMKKRVDIRSSLPPSLESVQSVGEDSVNKDDTYSLVSLSVSKQHIRAIFELTKVLGFKLSANLYNALIYVDAQQGNVTPVMNVIDEMKVDGITPTKDTWHLLMVSFIKAKDYNATVQVIDNMKAYANLEPDETTFSLHLHALSCDRTRESSVNEAIQLFDTMENVYGYIAARPHYHGLMSVLATKKTLDARDRIEMLGKKMELLGIPWNATTFNIQLRSAQLFGDVKAVKKLFSKARNEGITPTTAMYAWTIRSYGNHMKHQVDYENEYFSVGKSPVEYWNKQLSTVFGIYELLCLREDHSRDWLKEKAAQIALQVRKMEKKYTSSELDVNEEQHTYMKNEEELELETLDTLQDQIQEGSREVHVTTAVIDALLYVCSTVTSLALTHLGNDDGGDESLVSKNNFIAMQYEAQATAIWDTFYTRHQDRLDEMECFIDDRVNNSFSGRTYGEEEDGEVLAVLSSHSSRASRGFESSDISSRPCAKKTIYSYQIYIQLLCLEQRIDEAEKLFQELILSDSHSRSSYISDVHNSNVSEVVPTPRTYEALMMGHLASGEEGGTARALQYLESMEKNKMHISARLLHEFVKVNNEAGYKRDMKRRARRIMQAREEYMTRMREYDETEKRNYTHNEQCRTSTDNDVTASNTVTVTGQFVQEKTPFEQAEDAPIVSLREVMGRHPDAVDNDSKVEKERSSHSLTGGNSEKPSQDTQGEIGATESALAVSTKSPSSLNQFQPPTSSLEWWDQWRKTSISKHELFSTERDDGMPRGASNEERIYALKALGVPNPSDLKDHHHQKNKLLPMLRTQEGEITGGIWAMDGGELSYPKDGHGPESWGVKLWRERRLITKEYNKAMDGYSSAVSGVMGGVIHHPAPWKTVQAVGVSAENGVTDTESVNSTQITIRGETTGDVTDTSTDVNASPMWSFSSLGVAARSTVDQLTIHEGKLQNPGQLADLRQYPYLAYDDGTIKSPSEIAIGGELAVSPSAELVWKYEKTGDPLSPYRTNEEVELLNNAVTGGIGLGGSLGEETTFFTDSVYRDAHLKARDAVDILKRKEEELVNVSSPSERRHRLSKRSTHEYLDKWKEMYAYGSLEAADEPLVSFGRDEYTPGDGDGTVVGHTVGGTPKAHHRHTMSKTIKSYMSSRRRSSRGQ